MARIQILELPAQVAGEYFSTPFAIVIDQVQVTTTEHRNYADEVVRQDTITEMDQSEADAAARAIGAVGAILTAITLDVA